jgi:RNA polymerase I-specific transcription initiation factor RRN6
MSHCHDDHAGHSHNGDGPPHDHSDDVVPATQFLLYEQIDFGAVITLNESEPRSGAAVLQKPWAERLEAEPELKSDADEQLLMTIP